MKSCRLKCWLYRPAFWQGTFIAPTTPKELALARKRMKEWKDADA
jgi:hypothetical protein